MDTEPTIYTFKFENEIIAQGSDKSEIIKQAVKFLEEKGLKPKTIEINCNKKIVHQIG